MQTHLNASARLDIVREPSSVRPRTQPRLRVAFVSETYPPEVNGVAGTVERFVSGLRGRGHAVQLIRPRQQADGLGIRMPVQQEVLMRGLPIPRYPHLRMGIPAGRSLMRLWDAWRPDVVHIATEGPLGWSALVAARQLGLPVTSDFRTNFHAYSQHYGIGWMRRPIMAYLRGFHNRCVTTLVPTEALRQDLLQAGFERLQVVPRGVDTDRFGPAWRNAALRASWGAGPDDLVVGCVGRLAAEKNLHLLVAAFRSLRALQPRARLVLVGDGPLQAELRASCPDAVFAGTRTGSDLAEHYASFDLFLFPSLTETFGNVTTEALASGVPVVAFNYAAAGQLIVHGHNGALAPFGDAASFVARAVGLAADPMARMAMGAHARVSARALGWDGVVQRFEAELDKARLPNARAGADAARSEADTYAT